MKKKSTSENKENISRARVYVIGFGIGKNA